MNLINLSDEPDAVLTKLRAECDTKGLPWSEGDNASDIRCTLDYYANFKGWDPFWDRKFSPLKVPLEAEKAKKVNVEEGEIYSFTSVGGTGRGSRCGNVISSFKKR